MESGYKGLTAYKEAMNLAAVVYEKTKLMPKEELYGMISQMRRAAVSVPSNIAEGYGKSSTGEYLSALGHARGSLFELETQVSIAHRSGLLDVDSHQVLAQQLNKVLPSLLGLHEAIQRKRRG